LIKVLISNILCSIKIGERKAVMKTRWKVLIPILVAAGLGTGGYGGTMLMIRSYDRQVKAIDVQPVDFTSLEDGRYRGFFESAVSEAEVAVSVADGRIDSIEVLSFEEGKEELRDKVVAEVLAGQTLAVDAVSGATGSTKTLLKAIELAVTGEGK
jgi:uncharacterized protein with FMN-binding domain